MAEPRLSHRKYDSTDLDACVAVFRSNVPRFFREHELPDFTEFLDASNCPYLVVQAGEQIVGCGGYGLRNGSDTADLCWGMIHNAYHGRHLGAYLLLARLYRIVTTTDACAIRLETSQQTDRFFGKFGFTTQSVAADGIDRGLDRVEMRLALTESTRSAIERDWRELAGSLTDRAPF
jgi:hypothetical protein